MFQIPCHHSALLGTIPHFFRHLCVLIGRPVSPQWWGVTGLGLSPKFYHFSQCFPYSASIKVKSPNSGAFVVLQANYLTFYIIVNNQFADRILIPKRVHAFIFSTWQFCKALNYSSSNNNFCRKHTHIIFTMSLSFHVHACFSLHCTQK